MHDPEESFSDNEPFYVARRREVVAWRPIVADKRDARRIPPVAKNSRAASSLPRGVPADVDYHLRRRDLQSLFGKGSAFSRFSLPGTRRALDRVGDGKLYRKWETLRARSNQ